MTSVRTEKIRVVFGINHLGIGGAERMTAELLSRLDPERFECTLITLLKNPEKNLLHDLPAFISVRTFTFSSLTDLRSLYALYRSLKEIKPTIVVSSLFFSNTIFRVLKPFLNYLSIACEHNTYLEKSRWQQRADRLLAHETFRIVAVSQTVADFTATQEGISRHKFTVIPNGVDTMKIQERLAALPSKEVLKSELGFGSSDKIVLTVGRLVPQKNQQLLIDGFALFHESHPDYRLAIVGDGALRARLEEQVEVKGLSGVVTFFGTRNDVERFYKASDLFALTSDIEGFALVGVEAMACGLPVISTATAGPDEYIEDGANGFLVQDRSAAAIADTIQKVISGEEDKFRMGAFETAQQYAIAKSVKLYEQLFQETVRS